ncbi:hypothetical protein C464_10184 [Halorubrum coriense DSM 10284]|uniref:Uncharacterized protein n=1 Tax=Halorubrum coriense DSM 10284 TaxID=1227466 RepID=M0EGX6_9EURY|nr:hypothetical protein C464_10184 [Halorubrum coriense DSM 10284]
MRIYQDRLLDSLMRISDALEGEMSMKQMGIIMILYMAGTAAFGVLAVIVIHGLGWQWL